MFQKKLLVIVMNPHALLSEKKIIASMATDCNPNQPVIIAIYENASFNIAYLPTTCLLHANLLNQSISLTEWRLLIEALRRNFHVKKTLFCCHTNLEAPGVEHVSSKTHELITAIMPEHVILIAECTSGDTDSDYYAAGKSSVGSFVMPLAVKSAKVITPINIVHKIKQEQSHPSWILSRTYSHQFMRFFSCCCAKKQKIMTMEAVNIDMDIDIDDEIEPVTDTNHSDGQFHDISTTSRLTNRRVSHGGSRDD